MGRGYWPIRPDRCCARCCDWWCTERGRCQHFLQCFIGCWSWPLTTQRI